MKPIHTAPGIGMGLSGAGWTVDGQESDGRGWVVPGGVPEKAIADPAAFPAPGRPPERPPTTAVNQSRPRIPIHLRALPKQPQLLRIRPGRSRSANCCDNATIKPAKGRSTTGMPPAGRVRRVKASGQPLRPEMVLPAPGMASETEELPPRLRGRVREPCLSQMVTKGSAVNRAIDLPGDPDFGDFRAAEQVSDEDGNVKSEVVKQLVWLFTVDALHSEANREEPIDPAGIMILNPQAVRKMLRSGTWRHASRIVWDDPPADCHRRYLPSGDGPDPLKRKFLQNRTEIEKEYLTLQARHRNTGL